MDEIIEDQVVRRERFSRAHPEVSIEFRRETWKWEGTYPTSGNGPQTVYCSELRDVLDTLERHLRSDSAEMRSHP
jgi:hypothetical protein